MNTIFITSGGSVFTQPNKDCQQGGCNNPATTIIIAEWRKSSYYVCDKHKDQWIDFHLSNLPTSKP